MSRRCDRKVLPPFSSTTQVFRYLLEQSFGLRPRSEPSPALSVPEFRIGFDARNDSENVIDLARVREARKTRPPFTDARLPRSAGDDIA